MPEIDDLLAWEAGELEGENEERLFQQLVDTGLAWTLQGMYGRRAKELILERAIRP